jgi:hypothetical protein
MHDWSNWNWINVFFTFFSAYVAIGCWKDGRDSAGHVNAFASVINGIVVASKIF